jgi:hypothetical protein
MLGTPYGFAALGTELNAKVYVNAMSYLLGGLADYRRIAQVTNSEPVSLGEM